MSRIQACFNALRRQHRKALIPFITAGDPAPGLSAELMRALAGAGADLIELGVPFSDPMADGPVIQRASERALAKSTHTDTVFEIVSEFRQTDQATPVVLMGYLNPIEVMGYERFARQAARAGVDGVLVVDMPPEESGALLGALRAERLDPIFLISPTTRDERLARICAAASGYLYYVSQKGVTGADRLDVGRVAKKLERIRARTDLPIGVGFGIKDPATAAAVGQISDAVIIGSALVERIAEHAEDTAELKQEVTAFIGALRQALDQSLGAGP